MNVVKVVSDLCFGELAGCASNNQVTGCANCDLVGYMMRDMELALVPAYLELINVSEWNDSAVF